MLSVLRGSVAVSVLALGFGFATPAFAQSAAEVSVRMGQLEEEMRQLTGQVEELSNQVRQLKSQLAAANGGAPAGQPVPAQPVLKLKKLSTAPQAQPLQTAAPAKLAAAVTNTSTSGDIQMTDTTASQDASAGQGIEQIQDQSAATVADGTESQGLARKAPGPKILGGLAGSNAASQSGDGGFQGQVLVAPGQQEPGDDAAVIAQQQQLASAAATAASTDNATQGGDSSAGSVQPVALGGDTPEALYERSNESLLRRQFGDAEAGFRTFLQKYPDHALAGSAQYWLGETYYAQNDFRQAAQAFLQGYRKYPDGRRAADSLLKLGISLSRLGQTQQACAAFASVDANYPKSVDARRRAQAESKRASCAS